MPNKTELRQRNRSSKDKDVNNKDKNVNNKDKEKAKEKPKETRSAAAAAAAAAPPVVRNAARPATEPTLRQPFQDHPLTLIGICILVPYTMYRFFYFLSLQHPDYVSLATVGLVSLRPAVRLSDERQVLILGSMGSGTAQVAEALSSLLNLEILLEASNAEEHFTRDGTVSSVMAMRHLPKPEKATGSNMERAVKSMCLGSYHAFHPRPYRFGKDCSIRSKWSDCWMRLCLQFIMEEWGCVTDTPSDASSTCKMPFRRTLYLTRHPLRILQELMAKVCPGKATNSTPHPTFRQMASPFVNASEFAPISSNTSIPSNDTDDAASEFIPTTDSCFQEVAWYVVNFYQTLTAQENTVVQFEQATVCGIAQQAGFFDESTAVYTPNVGRVNALCSATATNESNLHKPLPLLETRDDELRLLETYTWNEIALRGGEPLAQALRDLCNTLGYNPDELLST